MGSLPPSRWTVRPVAAFPEFHGRWDALNAAGPRSLLLDSRFIGPAIARFGRPGDRLALRGDPARPSAMIVLRRSGSATWKTFNPPQAPLGLFVAEAGIAPETLLAGLPAALPGLCLALKVHSQDPDLVPRPEPGGAVHAVDAWQTARLPVNGDFDAYWETRSRNLRHALRRVANRLQREGVEPALTVVEASAGMADAVAAHADLEASGWKGDAGTALAADPAQVAFYGDVMEGFAAAGQARVFQLRFGERLVASDLCLTDGRTLVVLKTAYAADEARSSPSQMLREYAYRRVFERGEARVIEFYGPLMDWHTKWSEDVRTLHHLYVPRWAPLARFLP